MAKKRIPKIVKEPDQRVPLALTEVERKLILEDLVYVEDDYASVIRATPMNQPVRFALNDWEGLGGCIVTEAHHARDKRLKKELDRLYARIRNLLEDDTPHPLEADTPPTALKIYRGEDESEE